MLDKSRELNSKYIVPLAMFLMMFGFVALCQPWSQLLHAYSVAITLAGLILFTIFARFAPPTGKD